MLVWEDGYKTGIDEMDAEHLVLFALLNQLDVNINDDSAGACLGDVMNALDAYVEYHFAHEEALLKAWNYPGLTAHAALHHRFRQDVARLRGQALTGGAHQAALKVRAFVLDWLLGHILEKDVAYASFIAGKSAEMTAHRQKA